MDDQFDNRELIIEYLESGCKGGDMGYIGVEIEQFVLDEDGDRVPYIEKHGRLGVRDILEQLSPYCSASIPTSPSSPRRNSSSPSRPCSRWLMSSTSTITSRCA